MKKESFSYRTVKRLIHKSYRNVRRPVRKSYRKIKRTIRKSYRKIKRPIRKFFRKDIYALLQLKTDPNTYKEDYIDSVLSNIKQGRPHPSLGPNLRTKDSTSKNFFDSIIKDFGILPNSIVVDYGCGTLRIGKYFIDYLDYGNYIGLDLDDRLLEIGKNILGSELFQLKSPVLLEINHGNLEEVKLKSPDIIISKGVLQHIPPNNIFEYFKNLAIIAENADVFVYAKPLAKTRRLSKRSWGYSVGDIRDAATRCGFTIITEPDHAKAIRYYRLRIGTQSLETGLEN